MFYLLHRLQPVIPPKELWINLQFNVNFNFISLIPTFPIVGRMLLNIF